jgi:hypothetical protein
MREGWKLFPGRLAGIEGKASRRQPVQEILGHRAKVACALEYQKLVPDLIRIDAAANPETRQGQRHLAQLGGQQGGRHLEHCGCSHQILCGAVFDRGYRHCRLQIVAGPQQLDAKGQLFCAPNAGFRVEVDAAVLFGAQFIEHGRQAAALRGIGDGRAPLCVIHQGREGKGIAGNWLRGRGRGRLGALRCDGRHGEHQHPD